MIKRIYNYFVGIALALSLASGALVALSVTAPPAQAATVDGLVVGSYNTLGCLHGYDYKSRIKTLAKTIADVMQYDIVAVQEYASAQCRQDLVNELNSVYGFHWASSTITSYYGLNDASIIWNTNAVTAVPGSEWVYDIDTGNKYDTTICNGVSGCGDHIGVSNTYKDSASRFARKMDFTDRKGRRFIFLSTHFIAFAPNADHRNLEMAVLVKMLTTIDAFTPAPTPTPTPTPEPTPTPTVVPPAMAAAMPTDTDVNANVPILLVGDLNAKNTDYALHVARAAGYADSATTGISTLNANMRSMVGSTSGGAIDHIMYRNMAAPVYYETYYGCSTIATCGSDHRPVKAIFQGLGNSIKTFTKQPVPKITGKTYIGETLTATPYTWDKGAILTYQWYRSGTPISGANKNSYKLTTSDKGKKLTVIVKAQANGYLTAARASKSTASITLTKFTREPQPKIEGKAKINRVLNAKAYTWSPKPTSLKYQWLANGKAIKGATAAKFKVTRDLKNKYLTVRVTASKTNYETTAKVSKKTAKVKW